MISGNINTNVFPVMHRGREVLHTSEANAALFQSIINSHQTDNAFSPDLQSVKNASAGIRQFLLPPTFVKTGFNIDDCSKIPFKGIMPALQALMQEIEDTDLGTMTEIEKFDWIEGKFIKTFGADFLTPHALDVYSTLSGPCPYRQIGDAFYSALGSKLEQTPGQYAPYKVNRQRLYPGMSDIEIQDTIRAGYPVTLTNKDLFLMLHEMRAVGADGIEAGEEYIAAVMYPRFDEDNPPGKPGTEDWNNRWQVAINKRADIDVLAGLWNIKETNMTPREKSMYGAEHLKEKEFLIRVLGAVTGDNGLFESAYFEAYLESFKEYDLEKPTFQTPDLISELLNTLDEHDDELADKDNSEDDSETRHDASASTGE